MSKNKIIHTFNPEYEINSTLYSYIGLEFEKICINFVEFVFPNCTIKAHKRIYSDNLDEKSYIVPDVHVSNISKEISDLVNLQQNCTILLDFKRSISAISLKDIKYLAIVPDSILIFCLFRREASKNWKRIIKRIIGPGTNGKKILNRIIMWSATIEYANLLPEETRKLFNEQLNELDELHDIKKVEKIISNLVIKITTRYDPLISQCIKNLQKTFDVLQQLKYLVTLQKILQLKYFTKEKLLSIVNYSQPVVEEILNVFLSCNIIQKKVFSEYLPYIYFFYQQQKPSLIDYFELTQQNETAIGLKMLVKNKKIPKKLIEYCNFDQFRNYIQIDSHVSISSMFKIYSLLTKESVISPEEAAIKLQLNQINTAELLRKMNSIGFLECYKLEWEATVKCYSIMNYNAVPLLFIKKYLPELIILSLEQIKNTTKLVINELNELENTFGTNWYSKLQIYGVFVKYKELYPAGYTPDIIIQLIRKEKLHHTFTKVRKLVASFSKEEIDLLAIERENSGTVGKIKRYIVKDQNNTLYQKYSGQNNSKQKQIDYGIKLIEKLTLLSKNEIKRNLKEGWTSKVQILYVLQSKLNFDEKTVTVDEAMAILESNNITLSRTNFIRYVTPFSRQPFNLLTLTRTKRGEYATIQTIGIP